MVLSEKECFSRKKKMRRKLGSLLEINLFSRSKPTSHCDRSQYFTFCPHISNHPMFVNIRCDFASKSAIIFEAVQYSITIY